MRKLLSLFGAIGVVASSSSMVVACDYGLVSGHSLEIYSFKENEQVVVSKFEFIVRNELIASENDSKNMKIMTDGDMHVFEDASPVTDEGNTDYDKIKRAKDYLDENAVITIGEKKLWCRFYYAPKKAYFFGDVTFFYRD